MTASVRSVLCGLAVAVLVAVAGAQESRTVPVSVGLPGFGPYGGSADPTISANGRFVAFVSIAWDLVPGDTNNTDDVFVRDLQLGTTMRVSVDGAGAQGNGYSSMPSISADARFVAFESDASNLVQGDTNNKNDVFVRDLQLGTTTLVSVDGAGAQGNDSSYVPSISADGRFVAFYSWASNLVPGDTNSSSDVFVRDLQLGTTTRVSVDAAGAQGSGSCQDPSISADGRFVAFHSWASDLVPGDTNGKRDVFVRDLTLRTTTRVSVDGSGAQGNGDSYSSSISANGRFVAFYSYASNLVPGETNSGRDVFVRDLQLGTITRVSVNNDRAQVNARSDRPSMSADGRFVAFESRASNLVPGDTNGGWDVFVRDLQLGTTTRVSVNDAGVQGDNNSDYPSISSDGRFVAFFSMASNLAPGDTNALMDVFVRDLQLGTTTRVSESGCEALGNNTSSSASVSADGRYVAFETYATNLVPGDTNDSSDVFVRDLTLGTTTRVSVDGSGAQANGSSYVLSISADGRFVAFESLASNLVTADTNAKRDVFVRDLTLRTTTRVSVDGSGAQGNGDSYRPSITADGRFVAFASYASNLVPGDTNAKEDVFVRDLTLRTTTRVSVDGSGAQGNGDSYRPSITADGKLLAFASYASNLVPGDTNGIVDVLVRDLGLGTTTCVSVDDAGAQGNGDSNRPSISPDGQFVAFSSSASNLVPGDTNAKYDVFIRDLHLGTTTRVSVDGSGAQGNGDSYTPSISADGRFVAFASYASNLAPGDTNAKEDVFIRDLHLGTTTRVSVDGAGAQGNGDSLFPSISADGMVVGFISAASNLTPLANGGLWNVYARVTLVPGSTTVSGRVALDGYSGSLQGQLIDIRVWKDGALASVLELEAGANGEFSFLPPQAGDVELKFRFLTGLVKSVPLTLGLGQIDNLVVHIANGDCDRDNDVDIDDYDVLAGAYGTFAGDATYNPNADLDGDGDVDIDDYDILAGAYGQFGD